MTSLNFTKMQAIGNDYVYVDCFKEKIEDPAQLSKIISDRHYGIGSDGLILIEPSSVADCKMDIYNADGSRAEMCGNGIRCVGKYLWDKGYVKTPSARVETLCGIKHLALLIENGKCVGARVDMGEPELTARKIPVIWDEDTVIDRELTVGGKLYSITCVSMGNPHCVVFSENCEELNLPALGPLFENHIVFPARVNTEFVTVLDRAHLRMRVWERGASETMACGTGACAVAVAAILNNYCDREVTITLNGGDLKIRWDEATNHVFMEGAANTAFEGTFYVSEEE